MLWFKTGPGSRFCLTSKGQSIMVWMMSVQAAIDALLLEYKVEPEQLQQDVENIIAELLTNGLVEVRDS